MTRLGEISPLWQNLKVFEQLKKALFTIWQNFEPTLSNILCFWANLHSYKWPNIEKHSSHLVTLTTSLGQSLVSRKVKLGGK